MPFDDKESRSSYEINASALSGVVREPFEKNIPPLAASTLSQARGFATARAGEFNLDEAVSVSSAYTLVAARTDERDGSILTLATAVVEDLNILEVVTARRIVAQMMITYGPGDKSRRVSFAGSRIEGLRLAGRDHIARLNLLLQPPPGGCDGSELPLAWDAALPPGKPRAPSLYGEVEPASEDGIQCTTDGHIVNIPGYGKIILGELIVTNRCLELVSLAAELDGLVCGQVRAPRTMISGGGGSGGDKSVHA